MPLAPALKLAERFPQYLFKVLISQGVSESFMQQELDHLDKVIYCKSTNILGFDRANLIGFDNYFFNFHFCLFRP